MHALNEIIVATKNVQSVLSVLSVKICVQYVYDLQYLKNQANLKACFVSCVHAFKKAATTPDIVTIVSFDQDWSRQFILS